MAKVLTKSAFFTDLVAHINRHEETVRTRFQPLPMEKVAWRPAPAEWSILQCFDHLNQTHDYYTAKIAIVLTNPVLASPQNDLYRASFWGGIYMFFAFNPRFSFPAPAVTAPDSQPAPDVLDKYLIKQQQLLNLLEEVDAVDLCKTRVPIKKGMSFNLGDCLKTMVYHDALHMRQAEGVHAQLPVGG
jgi:hypothetical protein